MPDRFLDTWSLWQKHIPRDTVSPRRNRMKTLYDMERSGNCYKVRLLLALLGEDYERVTVDLTRGDGGPDPGRRWT